MLKFSDKKKNSKKERKIEVPEYAIVDYTPEAKELNVRGEANMMIYHVVNNICMEQEEFTWGAVERIKKQMPLHFANTPDQFPIENEMPVNALVVANG